MITQERAQELANDWFDCDHFNQFAKDGVYRHEFCLRYLMSIEWQIIAPEAHVRPYEHTKKNRKELDQLEKYFSKLCPYQFEWGTHDLYGYRIPYLTKDVPNVLGLRLPV